MQTFHLLAPAGIASGVAGALTSPVTHTGIGSALINLAASALAASWAATICAIGL
ncbi:MAG: hypothetical protein LBS62_03785 [Clostridiales bacterium]|nr:hypothetical protein [Clostridiales bacterium]